MKEPGRFLVLYVSQERMNGRQTQIPGRNATSSFGLQPAQKSCNQLSRKQGQTQTFRRNLLRLLAISQEKLEGVPVRINRVFTDVFL